jgi:DNA polymerase II small subunit/DNA polymerase delta subunit B
MTQQTAVEWLVKKLSIYIKGVISIDKLDGIRDAVKQANELHKKQVIEAYIEASEKLEDITKEAAEDYYNETYGKE